MPKLSILLLSILTSMVFAQPAKTDSMRNSLRTAKADTNKINTLNALTKLYWQTGVYDTALTYATEAKELSEKLNFKKGISAALNNHGIIFWRQGNLPEALKNYFAALKIAEEMGDTRKMAAIYGNVTNIYIGQDRFEDALKTGWLSVKYAKEKNDKKILSNSYNSIANIYFRLGNRLQSDGLAARRDSFFKLSIDNYLIAKQYNEETGNLINLAHNYNNIALLYDAQGHYLQHAGHEADAQKKYSEAKRMYLQGLEIEKQTGDRESTAGSYINLGSLLTTLKQYVLAAKYLDSALTISKEIGNLDDLKDSYLYMHVRDSATGDYKNAYRNFKAYVFYRDSLVNEENTRKSVEAQMNYEFSKKEDAARAEQEKKDAIAAEEKRRKNLWLLLVGAVATAVAVIAVVIFRSLRITRKQKLIIEEQKEEVERSKTIIEEKNKDITDSINYAKRIQDAKLPGMKEIKSALPDSFVLFKPKDIVSGDFYYFHKDNSRAFIAAADCTGHGVPGAFMSLIGFERLDDALSHAKEPSAILNLLNTGVKQSLRQSDSSESTRDGMDIALCCYNTQTKQVTYAGANRPLWIIRKGKDEAEEIKPTKKAIGGYTEDGQQFEMHTLQLQGGDAFYIFSDGYADTFGGKTSKKLTSKKFRELLISIRERRMEDQGAFLDEFIEDWKGSTEQVDDILVIGVRV